MKDETRVRQAFRQGLDRELIARENEEQHLSRRRFLRRSGGITIAVTLSAAAAPSLLRGYSSGK